MNNYSNFAYRVSSENTESTEKNSDNTTTTPYSHYDSSTSYDETTQGTTTADTAKNPDFVSAPAGHLQKSDRTAAPLPGGTGTLSETPESAIAPSLLEFPISQSKPVTFNPAAARVWLEQAQRDRTARAEIQHTFLSALGYAEGDRVYFRALLPKHLSEELARLKNLKFEGGSGDLIPNTRRGFIVMGDRTGDGWELHQARRGKEDRIYSDGLGQLAQWNTEGRGIYFVVNPGGESDADITEARVIFWEADDLSIEEQEDILSSFELDTEHGAAAVVRTKKSLHCYARLERAIAPAVFTERQHQLIEYCESDAAIFNPARLMRLPGFGHVSVKGEGAAQQLVFTPVTLEHVDTATRTPEINLNGTLGPLTETPEQAKAKKRKTATGKEYKAAEKRQQREQNASGKGTLEASNPQGNSWDIRNFSHFLNGCGDDARPGWDTCQCPVHTADNPDAHSTNSLHINQATGAFICHAGCDPKEVYAATAAIAREHGYKFGPRPGKSKEEKKEQARSWVAEQRKKFSFLYGLDCAEPLRVERLPDLHLPGAGSILGISSPTGSGKTHQLRNLKTQFEALYPDGSFDVLGYRNMLGMQTAAALGIEHISAEPSTDDKAEDWRIKRLWTDSQQHLAYCLDSLRRRRDALVKAAQSGRGVCLVLDEADATIAHLLAGGTLKGERSQAISAFAEVVAAVLSNGGFVIALEKSLTKVSLDFMRELSPAGTPIEMVTNEGLPRTKKEITFHTALNKESEPSDILLRRAVFARCVELTEQGERFILASDARELLEDVHNHVELSGGSMRRVDSATRAEQGEFMQAPAGFVAAEVCPLGYTSTAESGVDLPRGYYTRVVLYGSHLSPRALYQMMNRERSDIPVDIFCREQKVGAVELSESDLDVDAVIKQNRSLAGAAAGAMLAGSPDIERESRAAAHLLSNSYEAQGVAAIAQKYIALYEIRKRLGEAAIRGELREICEAEGFTIKQSACLGPCDPAEAEALTELIKAAKAVRVDRETKWNLAADPHTMSVEAARKIKRAGASDRDAQILSSKVLLADRLPGLPLNNENFVKEEIVKAKGRNIRKHELLWMSCNLDIARKLDRIGWDRAKGELWSVAHELPQLSLKAALIERSGLGALLKLKEHGNTTPEKIDVHKFLVEHGELMRGLFGLKFLVEHSPNEDVNKFIKALGYEVKESRKEGGRGQQQRFYSHSNTHCSVEVWEALSRKWVEAEGIEPVNPCSVYAAGDHKKAVAAILCTERVTINHDYRPQNADVDRGAAAQNPPPETGKGGERSHEPTQTTLL